MVAFGFLTANKNGHGVSGHLHTGLVGIIGLWERKVVLLFFSNIHPHNHCCVFL